MAIHLLPDEKAKEEKETEEEKRKRIGCPSQNIEELLKANGCQESLAKMKEHEIDEEQFWALGDGDFENMLGVKVWGRRKQLMKKIEEIVKEHEKQMEERYAQNLRKVDRKEIQILLEN